MFLHTVSSLSAVSCQSVTITSSISRGEIVCPGETVTFECVTRGSFDVRWTSDEYVGGQILFVEGDTLNRTFRGFADRNTIATFINDFLEGSTIVLVSQLRIIVSSASLTPSVACGNALNMKDRFQFRVPGAVSKFGYVYIKRLIL